MPTCDELACQPGSGDNPGVAGWIRPSDVLEGDLVFCRRPGFLQELCLRADEPWRHVGLAVLDGDAMAIAEVAGARFALRPLSLVVSRYEGVAIGRLAIEYRRAAALAARRAATLVDSPQVYAWDDVILAGIVAVTRRFALPQDRVVLGRAISAALVGVDRRKEGSGVSFTCSSFIVSCLRQAGIDMLVDLTEPRGRSRRASLSEIAFPRGYPFRSAAGCRITPSQLASLTRALALGITAASSGLCAPAQVDEHSRWATPGDLWRSPLVVGRWRLSLDPPMN